MSARPRWRRSSTASSRCPEAWVPSRRPSRSSRGRSSVFTPSRSASSTWRATGTGSGASLPTWSPSASCARSTPRCCSSPTSLPTCSIASRPGPLPMSGGPGSTPAGPDRARSYASRRMASASFTADHPPTSEAASATTRPTIASGGEGRAWLSAGHRERKARAPAEPSGQHEGEGERERSQDRRCEEEHAAAAKGGLHGLVDQDVEDAEKQNAAGRQRDPAGSVPVDLERDEQAAEIRDLRAGQAEQVRRAPQRHVDAEKAAAPIIAPPRPVAHYQSPPRP